MGDQLIKVEASGTHASAYGPVPPLEAGRSIGEPTSLGAWRALKTPLVLFLVALVVYGLFAWNRVLQPSADTHFIYQADAFLQGQLELTRRPPHGNDWASYSEIRLASGQVVYGTWWDREADRFATLDGEMMILDRQERRGMRETKHYFVSFPPGPAVLMMPFVAIWGYDFNDVLFTLFFAALNVALMYDLLRFLARGGRSGRSHRENVWLTVLFGFGTCVLWCANRGQVWYTALILGITFTILFVRFAIDARRPFLAGLFLALAFATRTPMLFAGILFPLFLLFPDGRLRRGNWGEVVKKTALFCIVPLIVGVLLMWMNVERFGSPGEFGHRYLAGGEMGRIRDYGLFNYHFLARNLSAAFTLLPRIQPSAPYVLISNHGMSLFFTTPVLFYLFRSRPRMFREDVAWYRIFWLLVAVVAIPHFFYQNTGWAQYGYRFSLDYTVFLIVLLAIGRFPLTKPFRVWVLVGFLVAAFGAVTFQRYEQFYTEWFFDP